jgi:hypothetical protein
VIVMGHGTPALSPANSRKPFVTSRQQAEARFHFLSGVVLRIPVERLAYVEPPLELHFENPIYPAFLPEIIARSIGS